MDNCNYKTETATGLTEEELKIHDAWSYLMSVNALMPDYNSWYVEQEQINKTSKYRE